MEVRVSVGSVLEVCVGVRVLEHTLQVAEDLRIGHVLHSERLGEALSRNRCRLRGLPQRRA